MTKQLKKYLKIQVIKYRLEGKSITKDCMKEVVDFCFRGSTCIDINIDWANLHNEEHPLEERLLIIHVINELLRHREIHACIIGEVINTQILTRENYYG